MKNLTKKSIILITILLLTLGVITIPQAPKQAHLNPGKIICIDGDTFKYEKEYYRIKNIDTPEKNEPLYKESSHATCSLLKVNNIVVQKNPPRDKYNRTLISIPSIEKYLIENCLAEPYYKNTTSDIISLYKSKCKTK